MTHTADTALVNARIRTLDPQCPSATAVAWRDGVITVLGDDAKVRAHCGAHTDVVDCDKSTVVPGLVDGHFHPIKGVDWTFGGVDLMHCRTLNESRELLARHQAESDGEWVTGYGLPYSVFPGGHVDGHLLADAVDGAPLFVSLYDGHSAVASPNALERAGVNAPQPLPGNSEVVCRNGRLTGELREFPAQDLVLQAIPQPTDEQRYAAYVDAMQRWNALGLTGVHAMDGTPATLDLLRGMEAKGDLSMRLIVPFTQEPDMSEDERRALIPLREEHGRLWRAGAAKFFIDGTIDAGTAWLFEPDTQGECCHPYWPDYDSYAQALALFADAGFQCATHAIGDRAIQAALDAYRAAGCAPDIQHRIEHIETLRDEELTRFQAEQVIASMQPVHADMSFGDDGTWAARLGPERSARAWRYGDLYRSGATVALGSDWPIAPADPRLGMASARLRRPPGEPEADTYGPEQALSGLEALEGYTTACAKTAGEADRSGLIRPGYRADFTAFVEDPVTCLPDQLPALPVALTVVDGRIVYRKH